MEFEWDENKNNSNVEKHGISFENAKHAFLDSDMVVKEDVKKDYGETRFIGIGKALENIILLVYTMRKTVIRIISARKANSKEKQVYYGREN